MSATLAVRIVVTGEMLEEDDLWVSHKLRRYILGQLWTVPSGIRVFIDLGPLKHLDPNLAREIADRPCAGMIVFESSNWHLAKEFADAVNAAALAKRVAS